MEHVSVIVNHPGQPRGALHAKQTPRGDSLWEVHVLHMVLLASEVHTKLDHHMWPRPPFSRVWSAMQGAGQVSLQTTDMPPCTLCIPPISCVAGCGCQGHPAMHAQVFCQYCLPAAEFFLTAYMAPHVRPLQPWLCNPGRGHAAYMSM